jgi:DNA repair protein RadC
MKTISLSPYALRDNDLILTTSSEPREYILKFRDLPDTDKPREKLISFGPSKLSTKELLAIVLGTGTKKEDVLAMSERILKEYGEKSLTMMTDPQRVSDDLEIPLVKAMQIVACSELGRRFFSKNDTGLAVIRIAQDVYEYTKDMRDLPREHLRGIYLDTHNRVIHDEVISIGTINSNIVHPREVLKSAIEYNAAAFILVHNHPSGVVTPSQSDIEVTKQIIEAGKIIGINLLDHVIVTKDAFISVQAEY